ncbi:hypothetical protein WNY61_06155 [Sulfitobacter sp. AS92]|uniref:hypothetical protein n=1 Tax=Sulfitobacter sp. AS92 TaxID=3135783 RepID=UPI003173ABF6
MKFPMSKISKNARAAILRSAKHYGGFAALRSGCRNLDRENDYREARRKVAG